MRYVRTDTRHTKETEYEKKSGGTPDTSSLMRHIFCYQMAAWAMLRQIKECKPQNIIL